ncbi:hypothetical protein ACFVKB_33890 [Rhodococcus sp. NPDC127530]|uniref:hypothetical protein n=1 Tax=unclassified Rhodococcus (in: high G+C Gram-positive bacteria) TaxID=192944 RepID=UPI00362C4155
MTPIDHADPDVAQATMFLGALIAEIDTLSGRIETAEAQARAAGPVDRGEGQRPRTDAQRLRAQLYEVHRLVDRLAFRFPTAPEAARGSLSRGERS